MRLERLPRFAEFGKNGFDRLPEARAVIHFTQMGEFVRNDVVDDGQRKMNQPPVQANLAITRTTAPARGRRRERIRAIVDAELLRVNREALAEQTLRFALQPPLHAILDLLRIGL